MPDKVQCPCGGSFDSQSIHAERIHKAKPQHRRWLDATPYDVASQQYQAAWEKAKKTEEVPDA